jgi:hypothetical protein
LISNLSTGKKKSVIVQKDFPAEKRKICLELQEHNMVKFPGKAIHEFQWIGPCSHIGGISTLNFIEIKSVLSAE